MKYNDFKIITEAAKVGREYQHLEDLLITDGAKGGIDAVKDLQKITANPSVMNLKWDGGAAVFWGREPNGTFIFAPLNQWSKLQKIDKEALHNEILHTGRARPGVSPEDFTAQRKELANKYAKLWDLFERATPKDFRGFLNGDLMFTEKQSPGPNGIYEFTPNKVTYAVKPNGLFGKMKTAEAFVAVHGKIDTYGADATGNLKSIPESDIMKFNNTPQLIVLPTEHPQVPLAKQDQAITSLLAEIENNANDIDAIANFKAPKLTGFKKVLYDYAVKRAKAHGNLDFGTWLADSKVSDNQKLIIRNMIETQRTQWVKFWHAFDGLQNLKHTILDDLMSKHGSDMDKRLGITAITNNKPGGEGYVKAMSDTQMAKLVNPHFRSAPNNPRFNPEVNEAENTPRKSAQVVSPFVKHVIEFLGSPYPPYPNKHLVPDINADKHKIIKLILSHIKSMIDVRQDIIQQKKQDVIQIINSLRIIGVDWPELTVIEHSIDAFANDITTNSTNESIVANSDNNILHLTQDLAEVADPDNYIDDGLVDDAVAFLKHDVLYGIDFMIKYGLTSKHVPHVKMLIDKKKNVVIKYLLKKIKVAIIDDRMIDVERILVKIKELRELGINWPEFDVIQQSVGYDIAQYDNNQLSEGISTVIRDIQFAFINDDFYKIFNRYAELHCNSLSPLSIKKLKHQLESHKDAIIQAMLRKLLHGNSNPINIYDIKLAIPKMKIIGINWPELDVIQQSVVYELNKKVSK